MEAQLYRSQHAETAQPGTDVSYFFILLITYENKKQNTTHAHKYAYSKKLTK